MDAETKAALDKLFATDTALYQERGFQRRVGWGQKPALINIDLANAWTREDSPFTCEGMDAIIPAVQQVLAAFRDKGLPIVFTTTAYKIIDGDHKRRKSSPISVPALVCVNMAFSSALSIMASPYQSEHGG